jgi:uncharacterized protein (UPF0332 family)
MTDFKPDDYIKYRLQRANETMSEIKILIENKLWNTAINRMYYACFYAVGALLVKNGVETSSILVADKNLDNYSSILD